MFATTNINLQDTNTLPVKYSELSFEEKYKVRLAYIKKQNNRCYYCNAKFTEEIPEGIRNRKIHPSLFPKNFFNYPIHLHHNHDTDMTIGAVHSFCNAVMWEYEDE